MIRELKLLIILGFALLFGFGWPIFGVLYWMALSFALDFVGVPKGDWEVYFAFLTAFIFYGCFPFFFIFVIEIWGNIKSFRLKRVNMIYLFSGAVIYGYFFVAYALIVFSILTR